MPDFVPPADPNFDTFVNVLAPALTSDPAAYGETIASIAPLMTAIGNWNIAYPANNTKQAEASATAADKEAARDAAEALIRELNNRVQARGAAVTDAAKAAANLPVHAEGGSPIPAPASAPLLTIDSSQRFRHTLRFRDAENPNRRGKPDGVFGCKLFLKIGGPPPASIADCEFITLDTASPYLYEFEPAAAGQTGWWIACWVNPRQENGPCSETVGATIPG